MLGRQFMALAQARVRVGDIIHFEASHDERYRFQGAAAPVTSDAPSFPSFNAGATRSCFSSRTRPAVSPS